MNLWKGEFIMRKNVKIIVGVVVLILVLVVGSFVGLIINRTNDHKFGRYVSTEGPWGMTATWVSEDSASYLVCKKENDEPFANVTAYFQGVDTPQSTTIISLPYSKTVIFLPISSSPPRGIIFSFSANLNKISFQISQNIKGSTAQFSKSRQREIFYRMKVLKAEEYFAYFPLLELHSR